MALEQSKICYLSQRTNENYEEFYKIYECNEKELLLSGIFEYPQRREMLSEDDLSIVNRFVVLIFS